MNVTWIQLEAAPSWAWALGILLLMSTLSQVTWLSYALVTVYAADAGATHDVRMHRAKGDRRPRHKRALPGVAPTRQPQ
jgi:threonine/homoserine efflux transporter RhtA